LHFQRGQDGALWIVFAGLICAPQGHNGVADVLIDLARYARPFPPYKRFWK